MFPSQEQQGQASSSSHLPTQTLRAGSSQPITQSPNGPRTFEEACSHFGFTHEEVQKLALDCSPVAPLSSTLPQAAQAISQARCAGSHSYPQQTSGKGEDSGIPYVNVALPTSLQPCASFPTGTTPSRLATRPDPNHLSHWEAIENQATVSFPDHVGPLNDAGESPLMAFVDRRGGTFCCLVPVEGEFCGYLNGKKERMLSHIRGKHLDQRPWRCGGQCGHDTCSWNFPSLAALTEHTRPKRTTCRCGKEMLYKNLKDHQSTACPLRQVQP